jgi:excisionase family DNA binding protein
MPPLDLLVVDELTLARRGCGRDDHKLCGIFEFGKVWYPLALESRRRGSMPDSILTLPEVAALLKVADKTVYTMAQRGQLPAFKVRGQWRFRRSDLDQWIDQQQAVIRGKAVEGGSSD